MGSHVRSVSNRSNPDKQTLFSSPLRVYVVLADYFQVKTKEIICKTLITRLFFKSDCLAQFLNARPVDTWDLFQRLDETPRYFREGLYTPQGVLKRVPFIATRSNNIAMKQHNIFAEIDTMDRQRSLLTGNEQSTEKSFVRADEKAVITCQVCSRVNEVSVKKFSQRKTNLNVKCSCSHLYRVTLDYRQSYRKSTNLLGSYTIYHPGIYERNAIIRNISFGGICFEVEDVHTIRAGQEGCIDFILDDKKKTHIKKEFSIQTVSGKTIGCKFKKSDFYEKEFGFYLLYNH